MKITKIYKESANLEDLSQDKVKIELTYNEWIELEAMSWYAKYHDVKGSKEFYEKIDKENKNAKIKWVK